MAYRDNYLNINQNIDPSITVAFSVQHTGTSDEQMLDQSNRLGIGYTNLKSM